LGLLIYALVSNPKIAELGRLMFAVGLLVTLLRAGEAAVSLLK
jgi:hypothetical protein